MVEVVSMINVKHMNLRISEILSMKARDVHLSNPAKVILYGKGWKLREIPILPNTVLHLQQYEAEHGLSAP